MHQLNYHHLFYFYMIAREGSISRAATQLHITSQTISGQLATFESNLGFRLFKRTGRRLVLSASGQQVFRYAERIFTAGNELMAGLKSGFSENIPRFTLGITDTIPKVLAYDFVAPVMHQKSTRFIFKEGSFDELIGELAVNHVDIVIAEQGLAPGQKVDAITHTLGDSDISFFAKPEVASALAPTFPHCLDEQPFLMPGEKSSLRVSLLSWLEREHIFPRPIAEFDDSALLKLFGAEGHGLFCAPTCIAKHVEEQYDVSQIGHTAQVTERFFAITPRVLSRHPLVTAICKSANVFLNHSKGGRTRGDASQT